MKTIIKTTGLILLGVLIGILISTKYCSKPTEVVKIEYKTKDSVVYKTDTLYKTKVVTKATTIPVITENKTTKTEYKDSNVTIVDVYPLLDSSCIKQLDSIKRTITLNVKEKEIIKEVKVTEKITETITVKEPNKKTILLGSGLMYNKFNSSVYFNYNLGYQFKNKILITVNGNVPFKNNNYLPEKASLNFYVPILKFK